MIEKFIHIIEKKCGINEDSIGRISYTQAINYRMEQHGINDMSQYLDILERTPGEIDRLIEEIIVPETWFFREENAFSALVSQINSPTQDKQPFPRKILSLPSSSGEEAYSIAIKLFENGYSSSMFTIDAIDISQRNIDNAKKGIYRPHSFRNSVPENIIEKYFIESNGMYEISNRVKQAVNFSCANLFDINTLIKEQYYDVIFCRNLFIYFDASTKKKAITIINSILKNNGLLLIGHAEASIIPQGKYEPCKTEHSFGFIKRRNTNKAIAPVKSKPIYPPITVKTFDYQSQPSTLKTTVHDSLASTETPQSSELTNDYTTASLLADQGKLDEALTIATTLCSQEKLADNFSLLGIIYNAKQMIIESEQAFRKALYLDPDHYEALIHLSLLLDKKGETHTSSLLKKRVVKTSRKHETYHDE